MFEIRITASSMRELKQKAAELAESMGAVAPTQSDTISQGRVAPIVNLTAADAPEVTFEEPATLDPGTEITEAPAQEKPAKKAAKKTAKKAETVEAPAVSFDDADGESPAKDPEEAPEEVDKMDEESTETEQGADDISASEESEPVEDKPAFDFDALTEAMCRQVTKDDVGKQVVDFSPHKATLTIQNLAKQKIVANREAVVALLENYGIKAASRINVGRYFEFIEDMRKIK